MLRTLLVRGMIVGVIAGILAFAFAMLEVSDSLVLAQKQADYPIAKAIYELSNILGEGRYLAAALGVWAMIFLGLTIAAASRSNSVRAALAGFAVASQTP